MAAPAGPPPLTKAQIARIRRAPIHRRIKHCVYGALALAVIGAVANVTCLVLGAVWARHIVDAQRWCVPRSPLFTGTLSFADLLCTNAGSSCTTRSQRCCR